MPLTISIGFIIRGVLRYLQLRDHKKGENKNISEYYIGMTIAYK